MIYKETTIVLGAGVSKPYGFPTGLELKNEIIEHLLVLNDWRFWQDLGIREEEVKEFCTRLRDSHIYSIDKFLENSPEFLIIGKICIALIIRLKEDRKNFSKADVVGKGIYEYLFNEMMAGIRWNQINKNHLCIISFNYDRSFEQYLFESYKNICPRNTDKNEIIQSINGIPIFHVHGSVGRLDWQDKYGLPYRKIKSVDILDNISINELVKASKQIQIVSEKKANNENIENNGFYYYLSGSQRIIFLGFGYHEENLTKLNLKSIKHNDNEITKNKVEDAKMNIFKGNAYNLGKSEMGRIQNKWGIFLPTNSMNDLQLLRDYVELD